MDTEKLSLHTTLFVFMIRYFILSLFVFYTTILLSQDSDAILVEQKTAISYKNKKLSTVHSFQIQVNNRDGDIYGQIAIPHSPLNKVSNISGYVTNPYGKVVKKLKKSDLTERSNFASYSFYEDDLMTEFTLRHHTYPYTIYYSYEEQEEDFVFIGYWDPVMDWDIPTLKGTLVFEAPKNLMFYYRTQGEMDFSEEELNDHQTRYVWKTKFKERLKEERYAPALFTVTPVVKIVPEKFEFEIPGSFQSWKTYGDWQCEINKELNELPESEKKHIRQLISGITDTLETVKVLYHYLQDYTRYINISIETGGLKPYPASHVALHKYGDCKGLSNYFRSLLEYAGIRSNYCKVQAGEKIVNIDTTFPSQQFNHIIVCVPFSKDTVWLDCTSDFAFGYLGTFSQGRYTLMVEEKNSCLVKTPALTPNDVLEIRKVIFKSGEHGIVNAYFLNTYRGKTYENLLWRHKKLNKAEMDRYIRNRFSRGGFSIKNYSIMEQHRDSTNVQLEFETESNKMFKNYGNETLVKILPFQIPQFEHPSKRSLAVQLDYPINKTDTLHYILPDTINIISVPDDQEVSSTYGQYKLSVKQDGQKVLIVKSFWLHAGTCPIDNYRMFYDFVNEVKEIENRNYILTTKGS